MPLTDQRHTVRLPLPDLIVRGRSHTVYAPVYLSGALVAPTSPTVSLYDPSNTAIVSAASATVTASVAGYTFAAGDLTAYALGEGWRLEWVLPVSGETLYPRNEAALVRNGLWPVISDVDITREVHALNPSGSHPITTETTFQDYIDSAWTKIQRRLIRLGNRPNLIMEPSALADLHLSLTLAIIFRDQRSRLNTAWADIAEKHQAEYEAAWSELNPHYDVGDDGQADTERRPVQPTVWLSGGRSGLRMPARIFEKLSRMASIAVPCPTTR